MQLLLLLLLLYDILSVSVHVYVYTTEFIPSAARFIGIRVCARSELHKSTLNKPQICSS